MKGTILVVLAFVGVFIAGTVTGGVLAVQIFKLQQQQKAPPEHRPQEGQGQGQGQAWRPRRPIAPEQFNAQLMRRFSTQLNLTPAQHEQIQPMVNEAAESLRRLRRDTAHSTELLIERLEDEISAVLTPPQRIRFDQMIARQRELLRRYNLQLQQRMEQQRLRQQQQQQKPPQPPAPANQPG